MNAPRPQRWLFAALLLMVCACTPAPEPRLRVGTVPWLGNEPLFLGRDLGLLPEQHVYLVEYVSTAQAMRAFRNGAVDAISTTLEEVLLLDQHGHEARVVLVLDSSHGADCLMARPEVKALSQLASRRIGAEESLLGLYMLHRMFERAGLRDEQLQLEFTALENQVEAYSKGKLDAVMTSEPHCQRLADLGARRLFDSSLIPGEVVDVLVVRKDFLDAYPRQIDALLRGWFATLTWRREHSQEAMRRMARRFNLEPRQIQRAWSSVHLMDEHDQREQLVGPRPRLSKTIERLGELLLRHHLLVNQPEPSRLFDATPLRRVSP